MTLTALIVVCAVIMSADLLSRTVWTNVYELKALRAKKRQALHPYALPYRRRPVVSVIVYAKNHEKTIERCLRSVVKGSYRKIEVIVVDNASTDMTVALIRKFIKEYPKISIKLLAKRKPTTKQICLVSAYKAHANGEYVFNLEASEMTAKHSIASAVRHLNLDSELDGLTPAYTLARVSSLSGILQMYHLLMRREASKRSSLTGMIRFDSTGLLRAARYQEVIKSGEGRIKQADDLEIHQAEITGLIHSLKWNFINHRLALQQALCGFTALRREPLRAILAIVTLLLTLSLPVVLTYIIYLAINLHQPTLYLAALGLLYTSVTLAIWNDSHLSYRAKLIYLLLAVITQPFIYIASLVRGAALLFMAYKKLLNLMASLRFVRRRLAPYLSPSR